MAVMGLMYEAKRKNLYITNIIRRCQKKFRELSTIEVSQPGRFWRENSNSHGFHFNLIALNLNVGCNRGNYNPIHRCWWNSGEYSRHHYTQVTFIHSSV